MNDNLTAQAPIETPAFALAVLFIAVLLFVFVIVPALTGQSITEWLQRITGRSHR